MKRFLRAATTLTLVLAVTFILVLDAHGTKVTRRIMTDEEFHRLKKEIGVYDPGKNYNVIIDGHGTGLKPPTEEQWQKIRNVPIIAEAIESGLTSLSASVDHSATAWFPPIGNQDGEGSCTAWATTYYTKTFQEAREHGWDLSGCLWEGGYYGYPNTDQDKIFSPDFVYHLINGGRDRGSWFWDAIDLMEAIGAASWLNMPYDPNDSRSWPSEAAWREAPAYRSEAYSMIELSPDLDLDGISKLKTFLANNNLAVIGIDANEYSKLDAVDLWTSETYSSTSVNHANTIVGYNDTFGPYIENGDTKFGAFKVANSWGVGSWENVDDGFYWITPQCLEEHISGAHCYENITGYNPEVIAVFGIQHAHRGDCQIGVEIGAATKDFTENIVGGSGKVPFPGNLMVMDVTELALSPPANPVEATLSVYDGYSGVTGKITHFSIETYADYLSGVSTGDSISTDTPLDTVNKATVILTLWISLSAVW